MPSTVILEKKQAQVAALAERIKGSVAGVVVDYKGINVEDDTKLRKELREAGVEYTVIKNSILKRAPMKQALTAWIRFLKAPLLLQPVPKIMLHQQEFLTNSLRLMISLI